MQTFSEPQQQPLPPCRETAEVLGNAQGAKLLTGIADHKHSTHSKTSIEVFEFLEIPLKRQAREARWGILLEITKITIINFTARNGPAVLLSENRGSGAD